MFLLICFYDQPSNCFYLPLFPSYTVSAIPSFVILLYYFLLSAFIDNHNIPPLVSDVPCYYIILLWFRSLVTYCALPLIFFVQTSLLRFTLHPNYRNRLSYFSTLNLPNGYSSKVLILYFVSSCLLETFIMTFTYCNNNLQSFIYFDINYLKLYKIGFENIG